MPSSLNQSAAADRRATHFTSPAASLVAVLWLAAALLTAVTASAHHGFVHVLDSGGANDAVDQSDLTVLSYDGSHAGTFSVQWSWDKITFSGANTGDACTLFDTDGDRDINYSLCVQVEDNGSGTAVMAAGFPRLFSCNDNWMDRCGTPSPLALGGTTCSVSTVATDPFGAGESYPSDTAAQCDVPTGVLAGTPVFTTVCSYPSAGNGGNNNPVDCVVPPGTVVADLNVTLTDGTTSVAQGGSTTYTLTVRDPGPNHGHNAVLQMPAATGITKTTIACAASGGAVCPAAVTLAQLEAGVTLTTFPLNSSLVFTIGATVTAASGTVTSTATITPAAGTIDPATGDNTATDVNGITVPANFADLSVTKTNSVTSVTAGGSTSYSVVVSNAGPDAADGATVTDAVASGLSKTGVSCVATGGAVCPPSPTTTQLESGLTIPTLPNGGSVTFTVTATVSATSGNVTNTASVAVPTGTGDPSTGNNAASDSDSVTPATVSADLAISKTNGGGSVTSGSTTTYTIVVSNTGPGVADGAVVTDASVIGVSKAGVTCSASGGAVCPSPITVAQLEGSGAAIPTLPPGGSVTFQVTATVTAVSGSVTNTAAVAPPAGVTDPNPGNSTAIDTDAVVPAITQADLAISITNGSSSVTAGGTTAYTVVLSNLGPSAGDGATISHPPSAGTTKLSVSCAAAGGAVCPPSVTVAQLESGLVVSTLPSGGVLTFTVNASVAATSGSITNGVTATPPSGLTDPNSVNNSAVDTDSVVSVTTQADLGVTLTNDVTSVVAGQSVTYSLTVTNGGPSAVSGATVTSGAPSGLTFNTWTCAGAGGSVCPASGTGNLSSLVDLPVGGSVVFTIRATVGAPPSTSLVTTATVVAPAGVTDSTPGNNTATDLDAVATQRLTITERANTPVVVGPGLFDVLYTLDVTNIGTIDLTNLQVLSSLSETFAAGQPVLSIVVAPVASGLGGAANGQCVVNPGFTGIGSEPAATTQLLRGDGQVGVGQGCRITFTVRVAYPSLSAVPQQPQVNRATARTFSRAGVVRADAAVATATADANVVLTLPRLDITKAMTGVQQVGSEPAFDVGYLLTVRNTGGVDAPNVQVSDNLAVAFAAGQPAIAIASGPALGAGTAPLTLASGGDRFDGTTRINLLAGSDTMPVGTERQLLFTVRVRYASLSAIPAGIDLNNTARATTSVSPGGATIAADDSSDTSGGSGQPVAGDTPRPTAVRFEPTPVLAIEKVAGALVAEIGDSVPYAIRVRNVGGSTLPEIVVADQLPLGFRYIAGTARLLSRGSALPAADPIEGPGTRVSFTLPANRTADEVTLTYRVRVGPGALQGDGVNTAEASSGAVRSPIARARVVVSGGVFTTDACIIGTIYYDANDNGMQDAGELEPGVPGVRMTFEDGTSLTSDVAGRYSYCGLTPATHVLRVDRSTLPNDLHFAARRTRNGGDGGTAFVDLKVGEVQRVDFIAENGSDVSVRVMAAIAERREQANPSALWSESAEDDRPSRVWSAAPPVASLTQYTSAQRGSGTTPFGSTDTAIGAVRIAAHRENVPAGGDVVVQATSPAESPVPERLFAVGLLEGTLSLSRGGSSLFQAAQPHDVFDREIRRATTSFDNGRGQVGARGAFFLKGRAVGQTQLTMALDSDKQGRGTLFRDIQPEAFYPVYGDGSEKTFDAQSAGRFYLKASRGGSALLYGDLQTLGTGHASRQLGAYSRTLTGAQHRYENRALAVNLFASRDSLRQVVDEFAALGISGPYSVSNANGVNRTEKVEILTRDRNQPAVIVGVTPMVRFTDYDFEPFSGRLVFRRPVAAVDEQLNPQTIRVTYEVDAGAEKAWVAGGDAQLSVSERLQIGGSWSEDWTDVAPYRVNSVDASVRLGAFTTVVAEAAHTSGTINTNGLNRSGWQHLSGVSGDTGGAAARIELRTQSPRVTARAFFATADAGFNNPSSMLAGGRREAGGRAQFTLTDRVQLVGEALRTEDQLTDGHRTGALLAVESRLAHAVSLQVGVRSASESAAPAQSTSAGYPQFGTFGVGAAGVGSAFGFGTSPTSVTPLSGLSSLTPGLAPRLSAGRGAATTTGPVDFTAVRAKLSADLSTRATVYAEGEQDVQDADKHLAAVGGQFTVHERSRLYARHEFISSLGGPYALADGARAFNTAFGVSSSYLNGGDVFSEYRMRDAMSGREAQAAIGLRHRWSVADGVRLSAGIERLHAIASSDQTATATSLGLEYTRHPRLKGSGRIEWRRDPAADGWLSTIGVAHKLSRDWTVLSKNFYQRTVPREALAQTQDRFSVGAAYRDSVRNRVNMVSRYEFRFEDALGGLLATRSDRQVHVVSTHADTHPARAWTLSGQYAAKWVDDRIDPRASDFQAQLVSGRLVYDLTPRFDLGALASTLWSPGAARRQAAGLELGVLLHDNLWLSFGYNLTGFRDQDLATEQSTTRGGYVRLRMKVDEGWFTRTGR